MQDKMPPYVIKVTDFPKGDGDCDYTLAAWFDYDMDELAGHLDTKPSLETFDDEHTAAFPWRYRCICLQLRNGRYASLTQTEMRQDSIEIGLRLHNGQLLDEADLVEVLSILPKDIGTVHRIDNGFTWVPV